MNPRFMHQKETSLYNTQHTEAINKSLAYFKKSEYFRCTHWEAKLPGKYMVLVKGKGALKL